MRALDEERQDAARFAACGEADRFRGGNPGVALADDFAPAADDSALDEAEALERHSAHLAHEIAGRTRTTAARSFLGTGLLLRPLRIVMP